MFGGEDNLWTPHFIGCHLAETTTTTTTTNSNNNNNNNNNNNLNLNINLNLNLNINLNLDLNLNLNLKLKQPQPPPQQEGAIPCSPQLCQQFLLLRKNSRLSSYVLGLLDLRILLRCIGLDGW